MASLDNVADIIERLDREGIDYCLVCLQKGKEKYKSDIFLGIEDKESRDILSLLIESVYVNINEKDFFKKNKKKARKKPPEP